MVMTPAASATEQAERVAYELFRTPEGRADPFPRYHALRSLAPVHYSETAQGWVLTRYDDCNAVLRDPRVVRGYVAAMDRRRPTWREHRSLLRGELSMLNLDGPAHTRQRKLVSRAFTPRSIEGLRPRIDAIVDSLLDSLAAAGGGDLMAGLAFPLPVQVIGELLGVPEEDRPPFRDLVQRFTAVFELGTTPEALTAADEAAAEIDAYFFDRIAAVRADPADDLLSALVAVRDGEDRLSDEEIASMAALIFGAGFETTTNLIGNGILAFLAHPDQVALLRRRPELFANVADELLRFDGTVQLVARVAAEPLEVDGTVIGAGESVFPLLGAANRDPARYPEPDRLDVSRTEIRPLSFGGGVHFCLGAALARLETGIVFAKLLERFDTIELADLAPRRDRLTLRGPAAVPLTLGTKPGAPAGDAAVTTLPVRPTGAGDLAWRAHYRERIDGSEPAAEEEVAARRDLLERVALFRACTADELDVLAATAYPLAFDEGDALCREGADAGECYVLAAGEATVAIDGQVVATVGPDDVVGERGPLLGLPRAATVTASSHLLTVAISRDALQQMVDLRPALAQAMRDHVARRYAAPTIGARAY